MWFKVNNINAEMISGPAPDTVPELFCAVISHYDICML